MSAMASKPHAMEEDNDCPVCLEDYSDIKYPRINCGCGAHACQLCVRTYLLGSSTEPHCMDCKRIWSRSYQYENLGRTFVNKTYKSHREKILIELERARFPEEMERVKVLKDVERLKETRERFFDVCSTMFRVYKFKYVNAKEKWSRNTPSGFHRMWFVLWPQVKTSVSREDFLKIFEWLFKMPHFQGMEVTKITPECVETYIFSITKKIHNLLSSFEKSHGKKQERQVEYHHCPGGDCQGILDDKFVCQVCDKKVCSKCLCEKSEEMEAAATGAGDVPGVKHKCDPDILKNVRAMKKETRKCPRCFINIYKIEGCDQMWCTQCHVAFSWKTGREEKGRIHNPHFYEYQRKQTDEGVRAPLEEVCGGLVAYRRLYRNLVRNDLVCPGLRTTDSRHSVPFDKINVIYRFATELSEYQIVPLREFLHTRADNKDYRMKRILGEINDARFGSVIYSREKLRCAKREILQVLELLNTVLIENMNTISELNPSETKEKNMAIVYEALVRLNSVRDYSNKELWKISANYKIKVPLITCNWRERSSKVRNKEDEERPPKWCYV